MLLSVVSHITWLGDGKFLEVGLCPSPALLFGTEKSLTYVKGNAGAEQLLATGAQSVFSPSEQRQTLKPLESETLPSLCKLSFPFLQPCSHLQGDLAGYYQSSPQLRTHKDDLLKVTN